MIVAQVGDAGMPVDEELTLACAVEYPIKVHVDCFQSFFLMVSLAKPLVVELSTWIGVADCGCPIPRIKVRIGTVSWPLMYTVPISDSATEPITFDIICEMEWMGPFRCGRLAAGVVVSG